jgi:PAS domain S-box-containing protein
MAGETDTVTFITGASSRFDVVKNLTHQILATKDSLEVMRLLRLRLDEIIPYRYLSILFYNETGRYFYVDADLSRSEAARRRRSTGHVMRREGITILNACDTELSEILTTRRSLLRTYTDVRRPTSAEKLFFGDHLVCELAVPMLIGEKVLGIFHFSGDSPDCFSELDQQAAEEIAAFTALALERSRLLEHAQRKKDEAARWRDRYYRVFRAAGEAISLVNWQHDLIYESNAQFTRLIGRSDVELHGMRFSEIFSPESRAEVLLAIKKVEYAEEVCIKEVQLLRKNGDAHEGGAVRLTLFQIPSRRGLAIAVLQDAQQRRGQHPAQAARRRSRQFVEMVKLWRNLFHPDGGGSMEEIFDVFIGRIGEFFKARYAATFVFSHSSASLKLACAKKIGAAMKGAAEQPLLAAISEGPYPDLMAEDEVVIIPDVMTDGRFLRWRAIAEKLGYSSVIALPLRMQRRPVGLLCLYYDRPQTRQLADDELNYLNVVSSYLTLAIENNRLFAEAGEHAKRISVINEVTRMINSSLDMREVIRITAVEAKRVVDFDFAVISLFDEDGENLQILSIASRRLIERLMEEEEDKVRQIADSDSLWAPFYDGASLGWLADRVSEGDESLIPRDWLRSETSMLLLSQERFLGTVALYSTDTRAYDEADNEFLKQIAGQMAIAIGNARLFSDVQQRVSEFSALADVSTSISGSLEILDILKQIMKALMRILGVRGCRVQLLGKEFDVAEQQIGIFPPFDWLAVGNHRQTLIDKSEPVMIKNLGEYLPGAVDRRSQKLYGALLAHPVMVRERVIGVLYAWWDEPRAISRHETQLVTTVASQAASVIENARMYKESLVNAKQLEKVNEELESFVFTVSHDLKSPIVSIQGFSTIMLNDYKDRLDETARHYLERIQSNANQMERLIADLLELSRIGRVVNPFGDVPAPDIIDRALEDFALAIKERKITLRIQDNLPVIWCDPQRILQVFTNLISNAIKFTGLQAEPRIEIGCADKLSHYLFYVKDNGIGIDEKYHEKIFGLFQGLHNLKGAEGTGVGLTIVRRIIENHGGKVWVESSEGAGATFYFTLPKKATQEVVPP